MSYQFYHILHLLAAFILVAYSYMAFGNPDPARKRITLMVTGIASLVMLVSGFGLLARIGLAQTGMPGWAWVKLICWLTLSLAGMLSFRLTERIVLLERIALGSIVIAVFMVTLKLF